MPCENGERTAIQYTYVLEIIPLSIDKNFQIMPWYLQASFQSLHQQLKLEYHLLITAF
ncbi:hypothetical protein HK096_010985 [Nowakowskiella sp. JEL0078]|nr:hypothetical protein HK096_010985 [Nowakowskiella sp. JEL0078]